MIQMYNDILLSNMYQLKMLDKTDVLLLFHYKTSIPPQPQCTLIKTATPASAVCRVFVTCL